MLYAHHSQRVPKDRTRALSPGSYTGTETTAIAFSSSLDSDVISACLRAL